MEDKLEHRTKKLNVDENTESCSMPIRIYWG